MAGAPGASHASSSDAASGAARDATRDADLDARIAERQARARDAEDPIPHLQQLGGLFIAKARTSFDAGFYTLAEQCAQCIDEHAPGDPEARLLRGHVAHSLHRFGEAEAIAQALVAEHDGFREQGLLGDVLLDTGRLEEALACYQRMLDRKPCLASYTRAARVRWLRGDVDGARELLRLATRAGSRRDPEPLCWSHAELALRELQAGDLEAARAAATEALAILEHYAPALLVLARVDLAEGDTASAVAHLKAATDRRPEPEYLWLLADALELAGDSSGAARADAELERSGEREDPRGLALYLATRRREPERALRLAEAELALRRDVHTLDAHAWALFANGRLAEATAQSDRALAEGTADARLRYHAGVIATARGDAVRARELLDEAHALRDLLLPSEQVDLSRHRALL